MALSREEKEKIIRTMQKVKRLAVRGEAGEREGAQKTYEKLKRRYKITDEEVEQGEAAKEEVLHTYEPNRFKNAFTAMQLNEEIEMCKQCGEYGKEDGCKECATYRNIRDLKHMLNVV